MAEVDDSTEEQNLSAISFKFSSPPALPRSACRRIKRNRSQNNSTIDDSFSSEEHTHITSEDISFTISHADMCTPQHKCCSMFISDAGKRKRKVDIPCGACKSVGPRSTMQDEFAIKDTPEFALFGVFDGHGGCEASAFCKEKLLDNIISDPNFTNDISNSLHEAFIKTDYDFNRDVVNTTKTRVGTTAVVVVIYGTMIYAAHVGDSRAILCIGNKIDPLTTDHRVGWCEEENKRISDRFGLVEMPYNKGTDGKASIVVGNHDLPMTRAIGDLYMKGENWFYADQQIITCIPEIQQRDLSMISNRFPCKRQNRASKFVPKLDISAINQQASTKPAVDTPTLTTLFQTQTLNTPNRESPKVIEKNIPLGESSFNETNIQKDTFGVSIDKTQFCDVQKNKGPFIFNTSVVQHEIKMNNYEPRALFCAKESKTHLNTRGIKKSSFGNPLLSLRRSSSETAHMGQQTPLYIQSPIHRSLKMNTMFSGASSPLSRAIIDTEIDLPPSSLLRTSSLDTSIALKQEGLEYSTAMTPSNLCIEPMSLSLCSSAQRSTVFHDQFPPALFASNCISEVDYKTSFSNSMPSPISKECSETPQIKCDVASPITDPIYKGKYIKECNDTSAILTTLQRSRGNKYPELESDCEFDTDAEHEKDVGPILLSSYHSSSPRNKGNSCTSVSTASQILETESDFTHAFIVLATDGLWDKLTNEETCKFVNKELNIHGNPQRASEKLVEYMTNHCNLDDNIVVVIVLLNDFIQS